MVKKKRLLLWLVTVTLCFATPTLHAEEQQPKNAITLSLHGESMASALKIVQKKSGWKILYVVDDVKGYTVDANISNATAEEAVAKILSGKPFTYSVKGKFISIAYKATKKQDKKETGLDRLRSISGVITDESGETLIGASVNVPGSPFGTITGTDGRYELLIPENCNDVQVSYVGMRTSRVKVGRNANVNFVMTPDHTTIDEVVVTGYQTLSKERSTGSFSKITATDLQSKRMNTISSLLEGEVAGYNDGLIRGVTTMNATKTPLYVIDGFPVENTKMGVYGSLEEGLPDVNVDDIESITVLKDAAAASIYGARAANGVIVITTKHRTSKTNKTDVSFSTTLTWHPYKVYTGNIADSKLVVDLEKEWASQNPNLSGNNAASYAQNLLDYKVYPSAGITSILNYYAGNTSQTDMEQTLNSLSSKGYNYYDQMAKYAKRDPLYQQYNLGIVSNTGKNMFKADVTYRHDANEDRYSGSQWLGLNLANSTQFTKWLSLDMGAYMKFSQDNAQGYNVMSPGYSIFPYDDLENSDGSNFTKTQNSYLSTETVNLINKYGLYNLDITPLDELNRNTAVTKGFNVRAYTRLNIELTSWLKYSASFQYERSSYKYEQIGDMQSLSTRNEVDNFAYDKNGSAVYAIPYGNIFNRRDQYVRALNFRQQLDFNKTFGNVHNVVAILGTETRDTKIDMHRNQLFNYDTDMLSSGLVDETSLVSGFTGILGNYSYLQATDLNASYENTNRFVSIYGNASYTYDDRYTATGSLRWDRSNLWGTSSKFQNKPTWSLGAGWIISKEKWFDAPWVNYLKLRVSDGIGGNVSKNSAPYLVASYYTNNNVGGKYGSVSSRPNPKLSWEKTNTFNVGVDFALLGNRLNGTLEYYNKKGTDLLASTMGVPTEGFGYSTYTINNGEMNNRGFEASLKGLILHSQDWRISGNTTFGYNKNKVTYVNVKAPVYYLALDYASSYPTIGYEYNAIFGYKWAGLSSQGLPQVYDEKGNITSHQPTNLESLQYMGTTVPKYNGSFGAEISYKNFDFNILFTYAGGNIMRNINPAFLTCSYSRLGYITNIASASSALAGRWQKAGDEAYTNVPRAVFAESGYSASELYNVYYYSSQNILDADYLKLSNISLSYHIPVSVCRRLSMQNARVQVNVENPCMWTHTDQAKYQLGGYNATNYMVGLFLNF